MDDIYIIGAGGHGREVLRLVRRLESYHVRGFVDDNRRLHGDRVCDVPVVGSVEVLDSVGPAAAVLGVGRPEVRAEVVGRLVDSSIRWPTLVDPSADVSEYVRLGRGVTVFPGSILTTQVEIGDFGLINVACTVSHDVTVGTGATVSPGTHLTGNVRVGEWSNIGAGVDVIPGVEIGDRAVIGAGSTVIDDIPAGVTAVGSPARVV